MLLKFGYRYFEELKTLVNGKGLLVFDVTKLDFCYSACIKVFLGFSADCSSRPPLQFIISKATWQVTSLKMMAGFSPQCSVVHAGDVAGKTACCHAETKKDEESWFAPTGSGTIVTKTVCVGCGLVLSETSEHFD